MFGYLQFRGIVCIYFTCMFSKKIYEEQFPLFPPFVCDRKMKNKFFERIHKSIHLLKERH